MFNRNANPRRPGWNDGGNFGRNSSSNFNNNPRNFGGNSGTQRLNPWDNGMAPANNGRMGGLLPTPVNNAGGGGLLQHLSSQEAQAQLAIASNVLNALLPSIQKQQQNQGPPPLLSLNANNRTGGLLPLATPPVPVNFQNRNNGPQRHRPHINNPRKPEPYKMGNRGHRPGMKTDDKSSIPPRSTRSPAPSPKKGISQQAVKEDSEKGEIKEKVCGRDEKKQDQNQDKDKKDDSYDGIPKSMMFCHVCNKNMWDGVSFSNHLKGRAHQMTIEKIQEDYRIQIDLMRRRMQVDEEQHQIEIERKKRQGKLVAPQTRQYCTMCDLHFTGILVQHRKHHLHQQLKAFLHPKCKVCNKEFASRIDWDNHQLSLPHLKRAASADKSEKSGEDGDEEMHIKTDAKAEPDAVAPAESVSGDKKESKENGEEPKGNTVTAEESKTLDYRTLQYNKDVPIGMDIVKPQTGFLCASCNRFLSNESDVKIHCKSQHHFQTYLTYLKNLEVQREAVVVEKSGVERDEENDDDDEGGNWKRRKVSKGGDAKFSLNDSTKNKSEVRVKTEVLSDEDSDKNKNSAEANLKK